MRAAFDSARAGRPTIVLLTGEAGIGKSTLVADAVATARAGGAVVAVGTCWDREGAPGLWPWVQAVRTLARTTDPETWEAARAEAGGDLAAVLGEGGKNGFELNYPVSVMEYMRESFVKKFIVDPASVRLKSAMPPLSRTGAEADKTVTGKGNRWA